MPCCANHMVACCKVSSPCCTGLANGAISSSSFAFSQLPMTENSASGAAPPLRPGGAKRAPPPRSSALRRLPRGKNRGGRPTPPSAPHLAADETKPLPAVGPLVNLFDAAAAHKLSDPFAADVAVPAIALHS